MLQNKVAIVTGGTRGIGYAIVKKYLDHGATVVLCGSRKETAESAVEKLKKENADYKVEGRSITLTSPEDVERNFQEIFDKYGRLDILVNNAGISAMDSLYEYDPKAFANILDLNVNAVFYCTQAAAKLMRGQKGAGASSTPAPWFPSTGRPPAADIPLRNSP